MKIRSIHGYWNDTYEDWFKEKHAGTTYANAEEMPDEIDDVDFDGRPYTMYKTVDDSGDLYYYAKSTQVLQAWGEI